MLHRAFVGSGTGAVKSGAVPIMLFEGHDREVTSFLHGIGPGPDRLRNPELNLHDLLVLDAPVLGAGPPQVAKLGLRRAHYVKHRYGARS